jgi:prevent-host-death family protein
MRADGIIMIQNSLGGEKMLDVTLADAKAQLSELIERAERGESVQITRDGKPVARIVGVRDMKKRAPFDFEALWALVDQQPKPDVLVESGLRELRDDARY